MPGTSATASFSVAIDCADIIDQVRHNLARVILGKETEIDLLLASVLSCGHVLVEDIPGVGKTTLAKAFARSIGGTLRRIQFTPDLLPSDITGVSVYNPTDGKFQFAPGPIFAQILLADEINRSTPRTQSALLEAMGEKQVTVDGQSLPLDLLFIVIATQNPIDSQGTYPLPESQLDRFAIQFSLGYPSAAEAKRLLLAPSDTSPLDHIDAVLDPDGLVILQQAAARVDVEEAVAEYLIALVDASRVHPAVRLGVSPRGAMSVLATARARALMQGRDFVIPDDLKQLAVAGMAHRLVLQPQPQYAGTSKADVIEEILTQVQVPR